MKENNKYNVTIVKEFYNTKYAYKKSQKGSITEMQQLKILLKIVTYILIGIGLTRPQDFITNVFWTHLDSMKLLNGFSVVLLMDNT